MSALERSPETVIATMRSHGRSLLLPAIVFITAPTATSYAIWMLPEEWMRWGLLTVVGLVVILFAVIPALVWAARTVTITSRRTVLASGLLARSRREVLHSRLLQVSVRRSPGQRLAGTGDLFLELGFDASLRLRDLPSPRLVQQVLTELMSAELYERAERRRNTDEVAALQPAHAQF